jgi:conjugative transfer signal peptidase TraF
MKVLQYFSILLISFIMIEGICLISGIRINTSGSIPYGIYRTTDRSLEKGDFVLFCPPPDPVFTMAKDRGYLEGGFCPGAYGYMIKEVSGTAGDIIAVDDDGVFVNGNQLPRSKPLPADPAGLSLPRLRIDSYKLGQSQVLLMSGFCRLSFDGRYFGPIERIQIKAVIRPVFTW